jgi:hypothetical protein
VDPVSFPLLILYLRPVATLTAIAVSIAAVTAAVTVTPTTATFATPCQNHVTFQLVILDIGNHRCWITVAVIRQQVRRDRTPGRKGHEQHP